MKSKEAVLNEIYEPSADIPLFVAIQLSTDQQVIEKAMQEYASQYLTLLKECREELLDYADDNKSARTLIQKIDELIKEA
jgi:hypothetical protein